MNRRKTAFRGVFFTNKKHETLKPYCSKCKQIMEIGHLCYMAKLNNDIPRSDNVLFAAYDFETTQDTKIIDSANTACS